MSKQQIGILVVLLAIIGIVFGYQIISKKGAKLPPGSQLAQVVPTSGLVGYWNLDGNANDSAGSYNGVFSSPAYSGGKIGQAASFTGSNYINFGNLSLTGDLTASFWINVPSTPGGYHSVFIKPNAYGFEFNGGSLIFRTTTGEVSAPYTYLNTLKHVIGVKSGGNLILYIDGVEVAKSSGASISSSNDLLHAAAWKPLAEPSPAEFLIGKLDEIRVYNRALSAEGSPSEITNLFNYTGQTTTNNTVTLFVYYGGDVTATGATFTCGAYNNGATAGSYKICSASVAEGTEITLTETTQTNFTFSGWTGSLQSSCVMLEQTCVITVPAVTVPVTYPTITANFTALATNPRSPIFAKSFTATPTTVNGGQKTKLTWTTKLATSCTLTGDVPSPKSVGTSNNNYQTAALTTHPTTFTLTCNGATGTTPATREVTVIVKPTITVTKAGTAGNVVISYPNNTNCATPCSVTAGTDVTLTATAGTNSKFATNGWSPTTDCTANSNVLICSNLTSNKNITATFETTVINQAPIVTAFTLPTTPNPYNSTTVPATITATDDTGVTHYLINESPTTPSATATGWTAITDATPTSISINPNITTTNGTHTFYAWTKDGSNAVSASRSAQITVDTGTSTCAVANGTCYVRPGATGANNGSNWTDAYTSLSSATSRGKTYYIAGGNYNGWTFSAPESGGSLITVKKATTDDHGTSTGWNSTYGTTQATFTFISPTRGDLVIDGGANPDRPLYSTTSSHYGIKVTTTAGHHAIDMIRTTGADVNNVTIKNVEVAGPCNGTFGSPTSGCRYQAGQQTDLIYISFWEGPKARNWKFQNNYIHGGNTLIQLAGNVSPLIEYNMFADSILDYNGPYDPAKPHDNIAWLAQNSDMTFRYNKITNWDQTGFYPSNTPNPGIHRIYGNYFYDSAVNRSGIGPATNGSAIWFFGDITSTNGTWLVYNNTFKNITVRAIYTDGGSSPSGNVMNNIFDNSGTNWWSGTSSVNLTHSYNWYSGTNQDTVGGIAGQGTNIFSTIPDIVSTIGALFPRDKGLNLSTTPGYVSQIGIDGKGNPRGQNGAWDIGAYEFTP